MPISKGVRQAGRVQIVMSVLCSFDTNLISLSNHKNKPPTLCSDMWLWFVSNDQHIFHKTEPALHASMYWVIVIHETDSPTAYVNYRS